METPFELTVSESCSRSDDRRDVAAARILYLTPRRSSPCDRGVERAKLVRQRRSALRSLSCGGDSHAAPPDIVQNLAVFAVGGVAAASLLPYVPTIQRVRSGSLMWKEAIYSLRRVDKGGGDSRVATPIRRVVMVNSVGYSSGYRSLGILRKTGDDPANCKRRSAPFCPDGTFAGAVCYTGFLRVLNDSTKPWYYVMFVAFAATCIEMIFSSVGRKEKTLLARSIARFFSWAFPLCPLSRARRTSNKCRYHRRETHKDRYTG